jgi:NAD(P)-dependent dehydrogenase (short-subunit alcohol dehydrogenase family)
VVADGDVVLVTGAAGGIGGAVVDTLADRGWSVLATDLGLEGVAPHASGRVRYVAADFTSADEMAAAVDEAGELGRLVGCVANAGILAEDFSSIVDASPAAWSRTLEINVVGVLITLQATARVLAQSGGGRMTATASVAGLRAEPNVPAYCASKAAVISVVRSLALELGPAEITVNAVAPGPVATDAQSRVIEGRAGTRTDDETPAQRFERHRTEGRPISRWPRRPTWRKLSHGSSPTPPPTSPAMS